jgi:hypothetical protein
MICKACGEEITRIDHVIFIDGEACCRETYELETWRITPNPRLQRKWSRTGPLTDDLIRQQDTREFEEADAGY